MKDRLVKQIEDKVGANVSEAEEESGDRYTENFIKIAQVIMMAQITDTSSMNAKVRAELIERLKDEVQTLFWCEHHKLLGRRHSDCKLQQCPNIPLLYQLYQVELLNFIELFGVRLLTDD